MRVERPKNKSISRSFFFFRVLSLRSLLEKLFGFYLVGVPLLWLHSAVPRPNKQLKSLMPTHKKLKQKLLYEVISGYSYANGFSRARFSGFSRKYKCWLVIAALKGIFISLSVCRAQTVGGIMRGIGECLKKNRRQSINFMPNDCQFININENIFL